ncbi:beta strand repeat-containing protein, partial [Polynucleobacter sp. AP-RePozz3-80-G7]|uniref:beta strand repeat-containing protein n=1 Tax=Polynucleobacter sp. AP-RePozz3-80-G7 TaxID=2689105 RepID=UPI001D95A92D|nr:hypothetical protein [Polynucleobacter sp. AP-RePozz3-80-G7]
AAAYNLSLTGNGSTITNAVTFLNTGTLTLGASGGTQTYTAGFTATAPSSVTLSGSINTAAGAVSIGGATKTLTLANDTTIQTYSTGNGANITISGPVQGTTVNGQALTLLSKGGVISVSGLVGSTTALGTITLGDANQTGTITLNGTFLSSSLVLGASSGANAFNVVMNNIVGSAGTTTVTGAATFYNTGTISLGDNSGDIFSFVGGVTATAASSISISGSQINATNQAINLNAPISFSNNVAIAGGSGAITLGATTAANGITVTLGNGSSGPINLASLTGTDGAGSSSNITFNTTGVIAVAGAINTNIGTVRVTNSGGAVFGGGLGLSSDLLGSLVLTTSQSTVEFDGSIYTTAMTNAGGAFDVKLYGPTTSVTSPVTFNTTGTVYYGHLSTDILTFSRGITHTTGNNALAGTFTATNPSLCGTSDCAFNLGGTTSFLGSSTTVDFGSLAITLNNIVLGSGVTLNLGAGNSGNITVASITGTSPGAPANIVINTTGTASLGAIGTNIGTVTVQNSAGTTFTSTVSDTTTTLTATTGTIAFNGALTATNLNTAAAGYNLQLNGATGTITNAVTFANTGTLTLGASGGTQTYTAGFTATAPSATTLNGTIVGGTMSIGSNTGTHTISLGSNTVLNTSAANGAITLGGALTGSAKTLDLSSGSNAITVNSAVGTSGSLLGTVTIGSSGTQTGAVGFNGVVYASGLSTGSSAYNLSLNGSTGTITNAVTFANTGTLTLGASGGTQTYTGGLTATAPSLVTIAGTIAANSGTSVINLGAAAVNVSATTVLGGTATGAITLGATTLSSGANLTIGTGTANAQTITSITGVAGTAQNITINTTGVVSIGAIGTNIGTLTVTNSGGTTFTSTVSDTTTTLTATTGTIAFNGALTATNLNTAAAGYNLQLNGATGTITNAVTFANTGTLTLGTSGGTQTYTAGFTATAPSVTTLNGAINAGGAVSFTNAVKLGSNTSIDTTNAGAYTSGAAITFNGAVDSISTTPYSLATTTGTGATVFGGTIGATNALLSIFTGGDASLAGNVTTSGSAGQGYGGNLTLTGTVNTLSSTNGPVNVAGGVSSSNGAGSALTINPGSGAATIGGAVSNITTLTINSSSAASQISGVISGGANLVNNGTGTLTLTNTNTYTGTTTINGGTLRLGTGGSLAAASALIMTGTSIFDLYGNSQSIASLTGA